MLALSPPLFSNFGWPNLIDPLSNELNSTIQTSDSAINYLHSPSSQPTIERCESKKFDQINGDGIVKKLNHNASERERRKKINDLFYSLRSLLPPTDQTKKLSIPNTVSRVLMYIPELQKEVEKLIEKKEDLMTSTSMNISKKDNSADHIINKQRRSLMGVESGLSVVSANKVGDREVVIQICVMKMNKGSFGEALSELEEEEEGLVLVNASSFETLEDYKVFYTLHYQIQGSLQVNVDKLRDKLVSYYEKEVLCSSASKLAWTQ